MSKQSIRNSIRSDDMDMDRSCKSINDSTNHTKSDEEEPAGTQSSNTSAAVQELKDTVIRSEELAVRKVRILLGTCVFLCGLGVTMAVYFLGKANSDQAMFELDYEGFVKNIRSLVLWEVRYNFALMEQLSASTTLDAGLMNATFPFQTHPQFEITGGFVDGMGGIMMAAFAPLVMEEQREEWRRYTQANQGWIKNSAFLKQVHPAHTNALNGTIQDHENDRTRRLNRATQSVQRLSTIDLLATKPPDGSDQAKPPAFKPSVSKTIYRWENGKRVPEGHQPGQLFAPLWQVSPADYSAVNANLLSDPAVAALYVAMQKANSGVLSANFVVGDLFDFLFDEEEKDQKNNPHGYILQPVYDAIIEPEKQKLVGFLIAITPYGNLLDRLLPEGKEGVIVVLKDDCSNTMTFELSDKKAKFLGYEDLHETNYDRYKRVELNLERYKERIPGVCTHDLYIYPSTKLESSYQASKPILYTCMVALAFATVLGLFILYDHVVTKRQNKTIVAALSSQAIVRSLFPDSIGRELISEAHKRQGTKAKGEFDLNSPLNHENLATRKTMAKLYPESTVIFADLVGFTAWSSMREPSHVFTLLETIYATFDKIAEMRRVFKVETVGDCYVAVCGVPDANKRHYLHIARFARDCVVRIIPMLEVLARELGPDTVDLGVRIGIHSGPVTAGVLRGDRARFQLFGDTVNTCSRVESTGSKNRIHVSRETADLLTSHGKGHWLRQRKDTVYAKGKGELETFWLHIKDDSDQVSNSGETATSTESREFIVAPKIVPGARRSTIFSSSQSFLTIDEKNLRLADWNTEILKKLLLEVVVHRNTIGTKADPEPAMKALEGRILNKEKGTIVLDELCETIKLPATVKLDMDATQKHDSALATTKLDDKVVEQLHDFVMGIALLYRGNIFHCFEHASHVTMSVRKLLSRITSAELSEDRMDADQDAYGITSDPLTQFAIVLSALIHDVDHTGVPNTQLIKEDAGIAELYRSKSVAEQNSIDKAWQHLMEDKYVDLRRSIYCNAQELDRFRKLVVNIVLATDIADRELGALRRERWNKAFSMGQVPEANEISNKENVDRKATIVIEHIIQASDIAHTMQHWHVYKKWNQRLFEEVYQAYVDGRGDKDPSEGWYHGELGFFDFYIIPLAKKLKECGVFGVSSDEYLTYANQNRREWEMKGREVVAEYKAKKCLDQSRRSQGSD